MSAQQWYSNINTTDQYINIYSNLLSYIASHAAIWGNIETGGYLFGLLTHAGRIVVMMASIPSENAHHSTCHFADDVDYVRKLSKTVHERLGLQLVGRWHWHHSLQLEESSSGDIRSLSSIYDNNHFTFLAEFILTNHTKSTSRPLSRSPQMDSLDKSVKINPFIFYRNPKEQLVPCQIQVIPYESPMQKEYEKWNLFRENAPKYDPNVLSREKLQVIYDQFQNQKKNTSQIPDKFIKQCHLLPEHVLEDSSITIMDQYILMELPIDSSALINIHICKKPNYEAESVYLITDNKKINITSHILPIKPKARIFSVYKKVLNYIQTLKIRGEGTYHASEKECTDNG